MFAYSQKSELLLMKLMHLHKLQNTNEKIEITLRKCFACSDKHCYLFHMD